MDRVEKIVKKIYEINSNLIKCALYELDGTLDVVMHNKFIYGYQMIDRNTVNAFLSSSDPDKFYQDHIDGNRKFRKVIKQVGSSES